MASLLFTVFFYLLPLSSTDHVPFFEGNLHIAQQYAKEHQKNYFVVLHADWCVPCKLMDEHTFTNKQVIKLIKENYIPVKLDVESNEGALFAMNNDIQSLPATIFFTVDGNRIKLFDKALMPTEMIAALTESQP